MSRTKRIVRTALHEMKSSGAFVRSPSGYRQFVSEEHPVYKPEKHRYILYVSHACPWANRCNAVRILKGLEDAIPLIVVHPTWQKTGTDSHCGWVLRDPKDPPVVSLSGVAKVSCEGCTVDRFNGVSTIRELYEKATNEGIIATKFTVPILWDLKTKSIVNNESSEIIRMLNGPFHHLGKNDDDAKSIDLYPVSLRNEIDEVNRWVYDNINNGVYKCGFAKSQQAYDESIAALSKHLDRAEAILSKQRYICKGDRITEADIRLFMTLVRFDEVYVVYFKCNTRPISSYPNLRNYCRELYQIRGIRDSVFMSHIKAHYFTSHPSLNAYGVIPKGPGVISDLLKPHDRKRF